MKFLFDLFPVIIFFGVYSATGDIYIATAIVIPCSIAQVAWSWWRHGKVEPVLWVSLAIIIVMGGLTLLLHDKTFIMWKPTALYWVFAAVLIGYQYLKKKNLIRGLLEKEIKMPVAAWNTLNLSWALFFFVMGCINLYVAYNFSEPTWVKFKAFGTLGLMLIFVIMQGLFLAKYVEQKAASEEQAK